MATDLLKGISELVHVPTGTVLFNGGGNFDLKLSLEGRIKAKSENYIVMYYMYNFNIYDFEFKKIFSIPSENDGSESILINSAEKLLIVVNGLNIKIYDLVTGILLRSKSNLSLGNESATSYNFIHSYDGEIRFIKNTYSGTGYSYSVIKIDKNNFNIIYNKSISGITYKYEQQLASGNTVAVNDNEYLYSRLKSYSDYKIYYTNTETGENINTQIDFATGGLPTIPLSGNYLFIGDIYKAHKVSVNNGFDVIQTYTINNFGSYEYVVFADENVKYMVICADNKYVMLYDVVNDAKYQIFMRGSTSTNVYEPYIFITKRHIFISSFLERGIVLKI